MLDQFDRYVQQGKRCRVFGVFLHIVGMLIDVSIDEDVMVTSYWRLDAMLKAACVEVGQVSLRKLGCIFSFLLLSDKSPSLARSARGFY